MMQGKVKFFKADKGYGFIESEGKDYFVHITDCKEDIDKDDVVEFKLGDGNRGKKAVDVRVVG